MILITGATGNNGGEILQQLLIAGVSPRILVRDRSKAAAKLSMLPDSVEVVQGDFADPDSLDQALEGVDTALLLSSVVPNQVELQGNFINAGKRKGVKHIVKFSMIGADLNSPFVLSQWHRQTEQQLESSGIAWTQLRPNDLMQNMQRFVDSIQQHGTIALPLQDGKVSMVDLRDVAAVAVKALIEPGHENKTYTIAGSEALSYTDIAEQLSAASGLKIRYENLSPEAAKATMTQSGTPNAVADMMVTMYTLESQGNNATVTDTVLEVTGKEPIAFDQFAQEFAATLMRSSAT